MRDNCIICSKQLKFFFSKTFYAFGLEIVDYYRCEHCGLVISKTHFDLSDKRWIDLNSQYHESYFKNGSNPDDVNWNSRLRCQADTIKKLSNANLLATSQHWVDYGSGDGTLASLLNSQGLTIFKYDEYIRQTGTQYLSRDELLSTQYDLVVCTSVFEHVRRIDVLDEINSLVSGNGVMALHTLVCDEIPKDPEWFYLLPVHCLFFTNRSMEILFRRWGYVASIYHVASRMWFLFKNPTVLTQESVDALNVGASGENLFIYKAAFVDYWKTK